MGAEHEVLLCHSEVHISPEALILAWLFELHNQISDFLRQHSNGLMQIFEKINKLCLSLAYLADTFLLLNGINLSLQGRDVTIIDAIEKVVVCHYFATLERKDSER